METKTIEGIEYILKSDVDDLVRARLSKVSERARVAEAKITDLEGALEASKGAVGKVADLQLQMESLTGELEQSRSLYSIHSTIADHGFTDAKMRKFINWEYQEAMQEIPKKEQPDLNTWLSDIKADPTKAPITLRPHLQTKAPEAPEAAPEAPETAPEAPGAAQAPAVEALSKQQLIELVQAARGGKKPEAPQPPLSAPNHSTSVLPTPKTQATNPIDRGLTDPDAWRRGMESGEIQKYYYSQEARQPSAFFGKK